MNVDRRPARGFVAGLVALALFAGVASEASGQANPLKQNRPGQQQQQQGNPLAADPGANVGKLFVPDYIKPGVRLVYSSGSSQEMDDPTKPVSAGTGLTRWDVIAVTDTHVLMVQSTYLDRPAGRVYMASNVVAVNAMQVIGGTSLWTSPEAMEAMRTRGDLQVAEGPMEIDGVTYDAVTFTKIDTQTAMRQFFDKGTGLKLAEQLGQGPPQRGGDPTGFNRKINSQMQFQTYREIELPWLGAKDPEWAQKVTAMHYRGGQTMTQPNGPPLTLPFTYSVRFDQRGDGWALGKATIQFQGQSPSTTPTLTGRARVGAYWMSPAALAEMKPGIIDRDESLGSTLSYGVHEGNMGRLGVLTDEGPGYRMVYGYDLNDGALMYAMQHNAEMNLTLEMGLAGRE